MQNFSGAEPQSREQYYTALWQGAERHASPVQAYLDVCRRRIWLIVLALSIVTLIVLWGVLRERPVYEATATLLIEEIGPQIVSAHEALLQNLSRLTEVEILKDYVLLEQVVDLLRSQNAIALEDYRTPLLLGTALHSVIDVSRRFLRHIIPDSTQNATPMPDANTLQRYETIMAFQDALKVVPREGTKLVDVTLSGYNPHATMQHLHTLITMYVQNNLDKKLAEIRKILSWLQEEEKDLSRKMHASTASLKDLRATKQLVELHEDDPKIALQSLSDLNTAYLATRHERIALKQHVDKLSMASASDVINSPTVLQNDAMKDLKSRYIEVNAQLESLLGLYKEKHPKILTLRAQLADIKNSIIQSLQNAYKILIEKETTLEKELATQEAQVMRVKNDVEEYGEFKSTAAIHKDIYLDVLKKIQEFSLLEASKANNVKIMRHASVPLYPVPSRKIFTILTGIVVGLGIGVVFALLAEYVNPRFENSEDVELYLRIPLLGVIPKFAPPALAAAAPRAVFEAYQTLRARMQLLSPLPAKTVLVTSAVSGAGKSTTTAHLGLSFAQAGQQVLLVDVDLRHPSLHRHFQLSQAGGLTDILGSATDWRQVVRQTPSPNLHVLSTGASHANDPALLYTRQMQALIGQWRDAFDVVIFDAPIVLGIPDVEILAPQMDGVLLVHNPTRDTKDVTLEATQILARVRVSLLGIVFNGVPLKRQNYYYRPRSPVLPSPA